MLTQNGSPGPTRLGQKLGQISNFDVAPYLRQGALAETLTPIIQNYKPPSSRTNSRVLGPPVTSGDRFTQSAPLFCGYPLYSKLALIGHQFDTGIPHRKFSTAAQTFGPLFEMVQQKTKWPPAIAGGHRVTI